MVFHTALRCRYSVSGHFTRWAYAYVPVATLLGALAMVAGFGATRRSGPRALVTDISLVQNSHIPARALKSHADPESSLKGSAVVSSVPFAAVQHKTLQPSGVLPLAFEPNQGQTDARVKYVSRGRGFTVFLTADEAVLKLHESNARRSSSEAKAASMRGTPDRAPQTTDAVVRMQLLGSNRGTVVKGTDELPGKTNYFRGRDPQKWHTSLANYAKVQYENIYPGVSLVYYGNQGRLEYDFEIEAGADPKVIHLRFPGTQKIHVDRATGDLLVGAGRSDVRFHEPVVYQADDRGAKRYLAGRYHVDGWRHSVEFRVAPYDHRRTLVIDPTLSYSTYLGGSQDDEGNALAVDSSGDVYVGGFTDSVDFPVTSGAFQTACSGSCAGSTYDAFVTKLNPSGSGLIYSTYLGGSQTDQGEGLAINAAGDAYITGVTFSSDFPVTKGAFRTSCPDGSCANGEGFVTELNSTGSALVYSTYLGGRGPTQANALALNSAEDLYVTGWTQATDFPVTQGVFQTSCPSCPDNSAGFVTELNAHGSALIYSTFLGGSNIQEAYAITLDSGGDAYVAGYTASTDFPTTTGAFQTSITAPEAGFVTKLNPTASALVYSTYLGGSGTGTSPCAACATSVAVDMAGESYVSGLTWETDFPVTTGAFQTTFAGGFHDAFLTKLNSAGSALIYSTYIGGSSDDGAVAVAIDSAGQLYVRGNTYSPNFPVTPGAFQTVKSGLSDAFFTILNSAGSRLIYSTYLGGSGSQFGHATRGIVLDSQKPPNAYLTGFTSSSDFPVTSGAFQTVFGGVYDAFVSKFAPSPNVGLSPSSLTFGSEPVGTSSPAKTVTLTNTGTTTLDISSVSVTGADATDFSQTNNCGSSVAAQMICTLKVTFKPTASGTRTAALSIADDAPGSPQTVALTGTGGKGGPPVVSLSPSALNFPTQLEGTTSKAQTVTLTNTGSASLTITSIAASTNFGETNTCGSSVAAGASCTISVTFTPGATGTLTGTVSMADNAAGSPQTVSLTGTGTVVKLSPSSLNFGTVTVGTTSSAMTVTLTNGSKSSSLSITLIDITGTDSGDFAENNTCDSQVGAQKKCTITVTFTPSETGSRSASVSISDNGGGSPQTVTFSGTGQ